MARVVMVMVLAFLVCDAGCVTDNLGALRGGAHRKSLLTLPPHVTKGETIMAQKRSELDSVTLLGTDSSWISQNIFLVIVFVLTVAFLGGLMGYKSWKLRSKEVEVQVKPTPTPDNTDCPFYDPDDSTSIVNPCHSPACVGAAISQAVQSMDQEEMARDVALQASLEQDGSNDVYRSKSCEPIVVEFCSDPVHSTNPGCLEYMPGWTKRDYDQYLWICLRDIYPTADTMKAGLNKTTATLMSSYATHAYVLYGSTISTSVAWDFTLTEHGEAWDAVLDEVQNHGDKNFPAEYAALVASGVKGTAALNEVDGQDIHDKCNKCFKSKVPAICSLDEARRLSNEYLSTHPDFTLDDKNCAQFACDITSRCVAPSGDETCDRKECKSGLMYKPLEHKSPGCGLVEDPMSHAMQVPLGADDLSKSFFLGRKALAKAD